MLQNVPEGIRTPDPRLRRPLLYPAELRTHTVIVLKPTKHIIFHFLHVVNHFFRENYWQMC